ncbi:tetraacyldisaccharide 4'-kinase [Roseateles saccharophilus]|uniref:Tetraacyldisaccharide 4'-kinase n=1 Tax=Roseateles saccharophilus TaxID=304 RepID=A0A4V2VSS6_ROSSA|nr:tetraacyldisaccharide 4'-kinase [Roseateles saccharophilus]TCV03510.1 lipid-A-disaccharide kinase [Roseateles saccharophilus]
MSGGPLSAALLPLSWLYHGLLALRGLAYRAGLKRSGSLPVPVIVVGNWIVGGAGKTPTTLALLELLRARGLRAGVVSRGYGRADTDVRIAGPGGRAQELGDEPLLIHRRAGVPVAVGADRVAAARALLAAHPELDLLVSDDGLQHWRLPRELSLLVFDDRGLGNGRLLPAGPLRQPPAPLAADELVIYNAARPSTALPGFVAERRLAGAVPLAGWWAGERADMATLLALSGRAGLLACAGLARPQRFFDMLAGLGLAFEPLPLADHADFGTLPWPADAAGVLLTEKDAVKLPPERAGGAPVWVVTLDFALGAGFEAALDTHLQRLFPQWIND